MLVLHLAPQLTGLAADNVASGCRLIWVSAITIAVACGLQCDFLPHNSISISSNMDSHQQQLQRMLYAENGHILSNQRGEEIDRDGLCEWCASIPWEDLANPVKVPPDQLPLIHHTAETLRSSTCRVCCFLGNIITSHDIPMFSFAPPHLLKLNKNMTVDNQHIGVLQFVRATTGSIWPLQNDFHVLVLQDLPSGMDQWFNSLMFGDMPLEVLKHSIATCQHEHGDECSPKSTTILQNLKVFDCETCEVVSAPADCRYVALSYVWGPTMTNPSIKAPLTPGDLPRTVADSCIVVQSLGYKYLWVDRYVSRRNVWRCQSAHTYSV
jgi:hypothetical protein